MQIEIFKFKDPNIKIGVETTWEPTQNITINGINLTVGHKNTTLKLSGLKKINLSKINDYSDHIKLLKQILPGDSYESIYDDDVIEITSFPTNNIDKLVSWYKYIRKYLKKLSIVESSIPDLYRQGGLHLNIDLPNDNIRTKDIKSDKLFLENTRFLKNIKILYMNNPWINWVFSEPNEITKSKLSYKTEYLKCCFIEKDYGLAPINNRDHVIRLDSGNTYAEYRAFSMPTNTNHFIKCINFQICVVNYIMSLPTTEKLKDLNLVYKNISLSNAKKGMIKLCKLIKYPVEWLDFTNMELRYSYDDYQKRLC